MKGLEDLKKAGVDYKVLFLEASDEVLIRRYKETRRVHPLAVNGTITDGITLERHRLKDIRKEADFILDTSNMKVAQLNEEIKRLLFSSDDTGFTITIYSFGYKHGIPLDADMVFDVRFIPNPYYLPSMRNLTGNSKKVQEYVMRFDETKSFIEQIHKLIVELIPSYIREGKSQLVIAFGCTGGQHRSVTISNVVSDLFKGEDRRVLTIHRDL